MVTVFRQLTGIITRSFVDLTPDVYKRQALFSTPDYIWGRMMAASLVTALPVVIMYALSERFIKSGLTLSLIHIFNEDGKSLDDYLEEMQKEFSKQMSPSYLKTVSMSELEGVKQDSPFNVPIQTSPAGVFCNVSMTSHGSPSLLV